VVGSISYMYVLCHFRSPERLSPDRKEYSYNSDIWSVGLVMYELATGKKNPYADLQGGKVNYFKISLKVIQGPPPELPPNHFSPAMTDFFKRWYSPLLL
jgi:serine/threonine protein kinase